MEQQNSSNCRLNPFCSFSSKLPHFFGLCAIALGLIFSGYFLKQGFIYFKNGERTVTVKGISERIVKSDLAIWNINFKNTGDDLLALNNKMAADRKIILDFLSSSGFVDAEIQKGDFEIIDKVAREYGDRNDAVNRYIFKESFIVRTDKVDLVTKTYSQLSTIIEKGVIISGSPAYSYTKFFDLRPEMLALATQSARQAALQFAAEADTKLGNIKTASQGVFSIRPKDVFEERENSYSSEYSSVEKRVRVVSTVTFNLE